MRIRRRLLALTAGAVSLVAAGSAIAGVSAWTTYHHDGARSGIDPDSTSPVTPTQAWQSPALDGDVYAEPLVSGSMVYVATENDTVYALNASSGAIVWQRHVATPAPSSSQSCGDISPVIGITSTPVIDAAAGRIYVVAETWNGSSVQHQMFGLGLSDGSVVVGPVGVDPSGSTPKSQLQRAGLALDAGKVIIGYGGNYGDCGTYHGWVAAVPEGGGALQTFEVDPSTNQGSIWGSGNAPAVDSSGNIWVATGNGSSSSFGYQESVIELDPNLNLLRYWAPSNWSSLDSGDTDIGSTMPLLLPDGLVFEIGKQGIGYLLNSSNLTGEGGAPLYQASVCNGSWGGGIYRNGVIYVACSNGMHALSLNTTADTFAPLSGWSVNSSAEGPPIYAGGLVWSAGWGNGVLYALNPASGATSFSANLGGFDHFATPSAAGGKLFIANKTHVTAYTIATAPPSSLAATTTSLTSSAGRATTGRPVRFAATVSPTPDGGTIAFGEDGHAIPGCTPTASPASCTITFPTAGRHTVTASYSGDASYASSAASHAELVVAPSPVLSKIRATAVHRKLRLTLDSSLAAKLTVTIYRRAGGRLVRRTALRLNARRGHNRFRPRMRALAAGRYLVVVSAVTPAGGRSKRHTASLVVR